MSIVLRSIYNCLDKNLKIRLFVVLILSFITPILELIGVAAIIPVIQISLNDFNLPEYEVLNNILRIFTDDLSKKSIIYILISFIFLFFLFKTCFLIFSENFRLKYEKLLQDNFSLKLFNTYIFSTYEEFSNLKFTEKNRNIGTVGALTDYLKSYIQIFVEILFFIFIFFFLLKYSFDISIIVFTIFLIISLLLYFLSKTKLLKYSLIRHTSSAKIVRNLLDVFYSFKEVIILKKKSI